MTLKRLLKIKGIGITKACEILAVIELGNRINVDIENISDIKITSAESIFNYYKNIFKDKKQEYFYCVYLDTKNKIIKDKMLFKGTINESLVHPREVFREAYLNSASSLIAIHNHPSGIVTPSKNDIELTKQLKSVATILGIRLLDHIIIGKNTYYSFLENGIL